MKTLFSYKLQCSPLSPHEFIYQNRDDTKTPLFLSYYILKIYILKIILLQFSIIRKELFSEKKKRIFSYNVIESRSIITIKEAMVLCTWEMQGWWRYGEGWLFCYVNLNNACVTGWLWTDHQLHIKCLEFHWSSLFHVVGFKQLLLQPLFDFTKRIIKNTQKRFPWRRRKQDKN